MSIVRCVQIHPGGREGTYVKTDDPLVTLPLKDGRHLGQEDSPPIKLIWIIKSLESLYS